MSDPGLRIMLGIGIVGGGFFVASLFMPRRDAPPSPELESELQIRAEQPREEIPAAPTDLPGCGRSAMPACASSPSSAAREPVVLRPQEPPPGPASPSKYPGDAMSGPTTWGMPAPAPPRPSPPVAPRRHRIVDGDTLRGLAEHYLGSPDRAGEIFAANRTVLKDPELLPIGVELTIPPPELPPATEEQYFPPPRLVPVPTGWSGK